MARTWILTGSPENHRATRAHGFEVIGFKPEAVLDEDEWIPAASFVGALDHIAKWPPRHWTLAFQGQIRPVSDHDGQMLMDRLTSAAGATA